MDSPGSKSDDQPGRIGGRKLTNVILVFLAVILLVVLLLACVLWIPKSMYPDLTRTDIPKVSDAAKVQELKDARLKLQNDARTTLLQGFAAVLVLIGAGIGANVTLRQVRATRKQISLTAKGQEEQLKQSEQGQVTDRYTKAIDQLDTARAVTVRLGGLYALERIARDSLEDRTTIAEVLCAYVRTAPRKSPPVSSDQSESPPISSAQNIASAAPLTVGAPDVHAAMSILGRWRDRLGELPPYLHLHYAELPRADLFLAHDPPQRVVGLAVTAAVEPVPADLARRGRDRGDTAQVRPRALAA